MTSMGRVKASGCHGSGGGNETGSFSGDSPSHRDAWSNGYQAWLEPVEVNGSLNDAQEPRPPAAYLLRPNKDGIDWFFNYHTGCCARFPAAEPVGCRSARLRTWRLARANEKQTFNNFANARELTPLVSLVQADGNEDMINKTNRGDAGDPYPGDGNNSLLNILSDPDSRLQNGGMMPGRLRTGSCSGDAGRFQLSFGANHSPESPETRPDLGYRIAVGF